MATISESLNPQSRNILEAAFSSIEAQEKSSGPISADFYLMPLERIHAVKQMREEIRDQDVIELAASIESVREFGGGVAGTGLLQPITLRPRPTHATHFDIVYGEHRYRAMLHLGVTHIPAFVTEISRAQAQLIALIENIQHVEPTRLEYASAIREMMDAEQISKSEAARRIGRSVGYVGETLSLLDAPADLRELVMQRPRDTARAVREMVSLPQGERAPIVERMKRGDSYTKVKPAIDAARDRTRARAQIAAMENESREPTNGITVSRATLPSVPYKVAAAALSNAAAVLLDGCRAAHPSGENKKAILAEVKATKATIKALENLLSA